MGLKLKTIEPVELTGKDGKSKLFTPDVDNELKLHLETADFGVDVEKDAKLLAKCFKDGASNNWLIETLFLLSEFDRQKVRSYLLNGEAGVELMEKSLEKIIEKNIDKV